MLTDSIPLASLFSRCLLRSPPVLASDTISCFVPLTDKQTTMTGRSWRHLSVFWPFVVAGVLGPAPVAESSSSGSEMDGDEVAPTGMCSSVLLSASRVLSDSESEYEDGTYAAGASPASSPSSQVDESGDDDDRTTPPGPDIVKTDNYQHVFKDLPLHEAMLEMFCMAARLGGDLFGDNVADTAVTSEEQISAMEERARVLGVDYLQTLYGHVNTSKVHRLVQHLGDELRNRGNLWEGDTSENEKMHASCKRMFRRSNKRGPGVALQMMRCDEAQSAVLQALGEADADVNSPNSTTTDGGSDDETAATMPPSQTSDLSFSGRGERVAVGDLKRMPALADLGTVLNLADNESVSVHKTVRIMARFEWGAPPTLQHLRATSSFIGKPWWSFVRYQGTSGMAQWGRVRLVLRSLGRERRSCVVVQRLRRVDPRPECVLTAHNCKRLAWHFHSPLDAYPMLELVDASRILRAEDIQVDWADFSDRLGLFATPANVRIDTAERHASRFFTNAFYPWTSRSMRPGF